MNTNDKSLHIGITTSVIQRGRTGVAQYVFALVRALLSQAQQHQITLFVLDEDVGLFDFVAGRMRIVVVPERWRPAVRNVWWHQTRLPKLARELQLDVLHVPSYRRMLWRAPCATVATIHDLAPFHVAAKYDVARMFYGRVVARALARRQDAVIAVSGNTARDIERYFQIPLDRQQVVLNGLDHSRFHPGDAEVSLEVVTQLWPQLAHPFFLYLSRIEHPGKNHLRLITAFELFKAATKSPCQLVLGGSDWHGAEVIHSAAQRSPFCKDIHFLGFVDDDTLPHLYRTARGMVYPSLFEGFGLPPVEAMACVCPVIASERGSLAEVLGESALVVDPDDTRSIAHAMKQVFCDETLRSQLIACGLENAQRFRWDHNAAAVLGVYENAVQRFEDSCHAESSTRLSRAHGATITLPHPAAP
jgi:glycosyltransferase involved in cell wall biosynthesis